MLKPDYKGGSIVNLMSSIQKALGTKSIYPTLKQLSPKDLKAKNIVLFVLDGLGYEYLAKNGKDSIFQENLKGKMTSVFPSTTAACVTTFMTGLAPQQHAMTAWYVFLKEVGIVTAVLPFNPRLQGFPLSFYGVNPKDIFDQKPFANKIKSKSFIVSPEELTDSDYSLTMSGKAKIVPYKSLAGLFTQTKKIIKSNNRRKYVYSYWPGIDSLSHKYGPKSPKVKEHFKELDKRFKTFVKSLKGTNTKIIITADHGLMQRDKIIWLHEHPKLAETLIMPLCGEPRAAYCYVHPSKTKQFEKYVKTKLKKYCTMHKGEDLIKKGYYGLFKQHPRLFDRVGDYILIMKDNYIIKDKVLGIESSKHKGHHGGLSKEELFVPLVVVDIK